MRELRELQEKLGYVFRDETILINALTHSSYANENRSEGCTSNERLEFLGDSVLGVVAAAYLYSAEPALPEGRMTKLRAELVCETALHGVAQRLDLGDFIRFGKGEEHSGGRKRGSILADAVEAVIAAMYLDGGFAVAKKFVMEQVLKDADFSGGQRGDYKTALQELVQRKAGRVLTYEEVSQSGPDHDKTFIFSVCLDGKVIGTGSGRTKKEAEQDAAHSALEVIK